jgi:hypothetical protein
MMSSVYISEQVSRQLSLVVQDFAYKCVAKCAEHYKFDAEEAYKMLGLESVKIEHKTGKKEKSMGASKEKVEKSLFPLPYNGEFNDGCCYALRQNNGLYTQCTATRRENTDYCKGCASAMQKTGVETPEYGTIQDRMAVDIFEYVDPKGRKPTAYTKVMKKYKINEEQVLTEARKIGIVINPNHFKVSEETKRGRPKIEKAPKEKGAKGRPKKTKNVVEVEGDDDDLFATLLADVDDEKDADTDTNDEVEESKKEAERLDNETKKKALEEEKAAKKKALEEEKAAKKKALEEEKVAKKKALEEEKVAKKKALEEEKAAKKKALEEEKAAKKTTDKKKENKEKEQEVDEEEPDVVKKIEFEGKKYLKSKKTGIIYDYNVYVKENDQLVVGKWNETTNKIDFTEEDDDDDDEEDEEEYDN